MRALLLVFVIAAVSPLAACRDDDVVTADVGNEATQDKPGADPKSPSVDQDERDAVAAPAPAPAPATEAATDASREALPAQFPADAFVPAGYTILDSRDMSGSAMVDLEVPGTPEDVFVQAQTFMAEHGWSRASVVDDDPSKLVSFDNGSTTVSYTIFANKSGRTQVSMSVAPK